MKDLNQLLKEETERRLLIEQNLKLRLKQQEAVAWFGEFALSCKDLPTLLDQAVDLTASTLEVELCKVLELTPGGNELLLRSGIGWKEGLVGTAAVGAGSDSQAGYTLLSDEPVIVHNLREETRFSGPALLHDHGVISGVSVIIRGKDRPFGVLGAHTKRLRPFSEHDARFLASIANILASAIERAKTEDHLRHSRLELETILNGISEGITVQKPDGSLTFVNQEAAKLSGFPSAEEMLRTPINEVIQKFSLLDQEGNPFPLEKLPGRQVLQGMPKASATVCFRVRETGEERWSMVNAAPIYGADGKVMQTVNIFRDVTEMLRGNNINRMLAEVGDQLASSLDYEETLRNIAGLLVSHFADWCTIHLVRDPNEVFQLAVAHRDPSKVQMALELQQRYPPDFKSDRGVARVLRTGKAEYFPEISDELIEAGARDAEHLEILHTLKMRAAMLVPLIARGRTLGVISLIWADSGRKYTQEDISLVNELARRAAIAIDNARLYQESQQINSELERRVEMRTQQLERSNRQLLREIEERKKAESALRKSEALLTQLFESAPDATILVDEQGQIVRVNQQVEAIFGFSRAELLGQTIEVLLPRQMREPHVRHRSEYARQQLLSANKEAANGEPVVAVIPHPTTASGSGVRPMGSGLELYGVRKDGSEFPIDVMLSPLRTEEGNLIISAVRDVTERRRLQTELSEMHRRLFESIETERLALSRELHDGPIQELYGIALYLEALRGYLQNPTDEEGLAQSKEALQGVIQTLREICGDLRPPVLEQFGLGKAIRSHLMKMQETHPEIKVEAAVMPDGPWLPEQLRLPLYRIYQNAIGNTLRHAQAKNIHVRFEVADGAIVLVIQDDGRGFRVPKKWVELARDGHFGLVGIVERVQALDGELRVESAPGQGTSIQVRIPF